MILILSVLLIVSAIALVYYWVDFYIRKGVQVVHDDWYLKFQNAFPVADMWAAVCALLGAFGLLTEQDYGALFSIVAGSSFIFLALMDITFNIENKLYHLIGSSNEMALELAANIWFLSIGIITIASLGVGLV